MLEQNSPNGQGELGKGSEYYANLIDAAKEDQAEVELTTQINQRMHDPDVAVVRIATISSESPDSHQQVDTILQQLGASHEPSEVSHAKHVETDIYRVTAEDLPWDVRVVRDKDNKTISIKAVRLRRQAEADSNASNHSGKNADTHDGSEYRRAG